MASNPLANAVAALLLTLVIVQTTFAQKSTICAGGRSGVFADSSDCRYYIFCLSGSVQRLKCHNEKVFSTKSKTCVPEREAIGECSSLYKRTRQVDNPIEYCRSNPSGILAHPTNCGLFYNCSLVSGTGKYFSSYMDECPYMKLFSEHTKRCEDYTTVTCNQRTVPKDVCDYRRFWCGTSHCVPCHIRFPSCRGKQNGQQAVPHLQWTASYMECRDERLIFKSRCPTTSDGKPTVFSPYRRSCVSVYTIPTDFSRNAVSCYNKFNGFYSDASSCRHYYQCLNNTFVGRIVCPHNWVFDARESTCLPPERSCSRCGTKQGC